MACIEDNFDRIIKTASDPVELAMRCATTSASRVHLVDLDVLDQPRRLVGRDWPSDRPVVYSLGSIRTGSSARGR